MSAVLKEEPQLSVELHMTQDIRANLMQGERALSVAQSYEIDSAEMAKAASDERTDMARRIDRLKVLRKEFIEPAQKIMDNANNLFNPAIAGLESGRKLLGDGLLEWQRKEQARVNLENAKREEEARKARQEAEQKAAAEQARAEEVARELRRQAQEAEERRRQAEAEGNTRAAAAAAAEAAKATERAAAAQENGAAKAAQAHMEAAAITPPPVETSKLAGMRSKWVAKLSPSETEESAKELIVKAAATNPMLLGLLSVDTSALNKMASALKGAMRVPGYTAVDEPIIAGSRK